MTKQFCDECGSEAWSDFQHIDYIDNRGKVVVTLQITIKGQEDYQLCRKCCANLILKAHKKMAPKPPPVEICTPP